MVAERVSHDDPQTSSHPLELPITEIELDVPVSITPNQPENMENSDEEEGGGLMDKVDKLLDADIGDCDDDDES